MKNLIVLGLILILSNSCGSVKKNESSDVTFEADKILGRSDGATERPSWAKETITSKEADGNVQFIGFVEVPGDSRTSAAFKMSDAHAKGNIASKIETSLIKVVETTDSGLSMNEQGLKSLIQEMSRVSLKDIDVSDRYWEKVQRTDSQGQKSLVLKCFSKIDVKKDDLKKMIFAQAEKSKVATDLKNKVEELVQSRWQNTSVD